MTSLSYISVHYLIWVCFSNFAAPQGPVDRNLGANAESIIMDCGDSGVPAFGTPGCQAPELMLYNDTEEAVEVISSKIPTPEDLKLGHPICSTETDVAAMGQVMCRGFYGAMGLKMDPCYIECDVMGQKVVFSNDMIFQQLPKELEKVARACLALDPADRTTTAEVLEMELFALPVEELQARWERELSIPPLEQLVLL